MIFCLSATIISSTEKSKSTVSIVEGNTEVNDKKKILRSKKAEQVMHPFGSDYHYEVLSNNFFR